MIAFKLSFLFIDDYHKAFGDTFESMFGNCWTVYLRNLLLNTIDNVIEKKEPGGYSLYLIRIPELRKKLLEVSKNKKMEEILDKLKIDPNNMKAYGAANDQVQKSFNRYVQLLKYELPMLK